MRSPRPLLLALAILAGVLGAGCSTPGKRIVFQGNESLSEEALRDAAVDDLRDYEKRDWAKSAIDDAAYAMERYYKSYGWAFATVEYDVEPRGEGQEPDVLLTIDEGPQVWLRGLEIEGNQTFPTDTLRALFIEDDADLPVYVAADIEDAASALESYYAAEGFLSVRVEPPEVEFSEDLTGALVKVRLHEGPRYRVDSIALEGDLVYDPEEVRAQIGFAPGETFIVRLPYEGRAKLLDFYSQRGHADAEVTVREQRDRESGAVALTFEVDPGPVVRIAAVKIEGLEHTRASLVRARLELEPGDTWTRERERNSVSALYRSGVFRTVEIGVAPGEGPERDLIVRVEEGSTLETWVEPGWGSYDLLYVAAGLRERDFLGTARTLEAEGLVSVRTQSAKLSLLDRWLFGSQYSGELSLFAGRREEPSFTRIEIGVGAGVKRSWTRSLTSSLFYDYRLSDATDVDVPVDSQNVKISEFTLATTFDQRDNVLVPTGGDVSKGTLDVASRLFGSELDYVRPGISRADYFSLSEVLVLATSVRSGVIMPTSDEEIPIQELFFNGGENTVRSYTEDDLGPLDAQGKPVGGEAATTLNLELRRRFGRVFELAAFADAGNVQPQWEDYFRFSDFGYGLGGGLRYYLPIGPVRLDAGWNPDPSTDQDRWVVHFSVGAAF